MKIELKNGLLVTPKGKLTRNKNTFYRFDCGHSSHEFRRYHYKATCETFLIYPECDNGLAVGRYVNCVDCGVAVDLDESKTTPPRRCPECRLRRIREQDAKYRVKSGDEKEVERLRRYMREGYTRQEAYEKIKIIDAEKERIEFINKTMGMSCEKPDCVYRSMCLKIGGRLGVDERACIFCKRYEATEPDPMEYMLGSGDCFEVTAIGGYTR